MEKIGFSYIKTQKFEDQKKSVFRALEFRTTNIRELFFFLFVCLCGKRQSRTKGLFFDSPVVVGGFFHHFVQSIFLFGMVTSMGNGCKSSPHFYFHFPPHSSSKLFLNFFFNSVSTFKLFLIESQRFLRNFFVTRRTHNCEKFVSLSWDRAGLATRQRTDALY